MVSSIDFIRNQYKDSINSKQLNLYQISFEDIKSLPKADLIIAWRSLSFMNEEEFPYFWEKIKSALDLNKIFVSTFFGFQHFTKRTPQSRELFRLSRKEIEDLFVNFQILYLNEVLEYNEEASEYWKTTQYENIYKIIACKK